jgi:hypothetical protein
LSAQPKVLLRNFWNYIIILEVSVFLDYLNLIFLGLHYSEWIWATKAFLSNQIILWTTQRSKVFTFRR